MSHSRKLSLTVLLGWLLLLGAAAHAENTSLPVVNPKDGLTQADPGTLAAIAAGQVDPPSLMALQMDLIAIDAKNAVTQGPQSRTSYVDSAKLFAKYTCTMSLSLLYGLMLDYVARSSPIPSNGGSVGGAIRQSNLQVAQGYANQINSKDCSNPQVP